jgi:hypothetical protein
VLGGLDFKGSVDFDLLLYFLDFLALFFGFTAFLAICWLLRGFPLLYDFLELF